MMPKSSWKPPRLSDLPDLSAAKEISVDLETYDPNLIEKGCGGVRRDGFITGYAIAVESWKGYLPVRHSGGNLPLEPVKRWISETLSHDAQAKVTANGGYEREWLLVDDIQIKGIVYDVQIAECLLNEEQDSYSLDSIAFRHLGERKDESLRQEAESLLGVGNKKGMHLLDSGYVGHYAEGDADKTLRTFQVQKVKIKEQGLWPIFQMESELSEVIHLMRQRGVRINEEATVTLAKKYTKQEKELYAKLQQKYFKGRNIDFNSGKDLESVCQSHGYSDYPRIAKTGNPSFVGDWMDLQSSDEKNPFFNPLAELWHGISEYRTIEKIRRDYLEGHLTQTYKGRIHCSFHQMNSDEGGTRSGRLAASKPPMQGIPKRSKFAKDVRTLFLPEEGEEWIKVDYSQQEYRIFVSLAMVMGLEGAKEAGQVYIDNPEADYHQAIAEMTGLPRQTAKDWNFAAIYGAGIEKTAKMTKKTIKEATKVNLQYHEKVPFAKQLAKDASNRASQRGWIKTIGGRILHFETWEPAWGENKEVGFQRYKPLSIEAATRNWNGQRLKRGQTHKALNRYVQGSAADMVKFAMLELYKAYRYIPFLQVHDELNDSGDKQKGLRYKEVMENVIKLLVPVYADLSMGKTWGQQTKVTL